MKQVFFVIAVTFLVVLLVTGSQSIVAQEGLALMKVEPAARPSGMGGAFVSIIGDPNSAAYNPTGAVSVSQFAVSFGHNTYWSNINIETAYFAAPLTGRFFIHGGVKYASVDDIESRLAPTLEPDALFESRDISFKGGLAWRFSDRLSAGFGIGWFMEKIGEWSGSTFTADIGVALVASSAISLGASATSLGSDFALKLDGNPDSDKISLPTIYRMGGSYRYDKFLGAADVVIVDDNAHLHVGAEADLKDNFSIRSGYMLGYDSKNFTAGASFARRNFTFDYAFVPYSNDLGTSHLFNLTVML